MDLVVAWTFQMLGRFLSLWLIETSPVKDIPVPHLQPPKVKQDKSIIFKTKPNRIWPMIQNSTKLVSRCPSWYLEHEIFFIMKKRFVGCVRESSFIVEDERKMNLFFPRPLCSRRIKNTYQMNTFFISGVQ